MGRDLDHPSFAARLGPRLIRLLADAAQRALTLHADELALEHVLIACLADEDSACHALVVHAFADPETVELELLALCPGIMVVGSGAALPFSPRAVAALERARRGSPGAVDTEGVLAACLGELPEEARRAVGELGLALPPAAPELPDELPTGSLFRAFGDAARRALSLACKAASAAREASISPARVALACFAADPDLADRTALAPRALATALRPFLADATPPRPRDVAPSAPLARLLTALPDGADTLDLCAAALGQGSDELRSLFERNRITPALVARSRNAFSDSPAHSDD